jgi:hypothetical protein
MLIPVLAASGLFDNFQICMLGYIIGSGVGSIVVD